MLDKDKNKRKQDLEITKQIISFANEHEISLDQLPPDEFARWAKYFFDKCLQKPN